MVSKDYPLKTAMWLFLITDALTFGTFLIGYGAYRAQLEWPSPVKYLGIELSALATFILICSSVSMVFTIDDCRQKNKSGMLLWLLLTILGGVIFLGIQAYEYTHLIQSGMTFNHFDHGTSLFATTFYAITGFHGLHVLTGVIYLLVLYIKAFQGKYDQAQYEELEVAGLFWHFVDLVWILVFTFIYLL